MSIFKIQKQDTMSKWHCRKCTNISEHSVLGLVHSMSENRTSFWMFIFQNKRKYLQMSYFSQRPTFSWRTTRIWEYLLLRMWHFRKVFKQFIVDQNYLWFDLITDSLSSFFFFFYKQETRDFAPPIILIPFKKNVPLDSFKEHMSCSNICYYIVIMGFMINLPLSFAGAT